MHPQHYYMLGSPSVGLEEAMWVIGLYYDIKKEPVEMTDSGERS